MGHVGEDGFAVLIQNLGADRHAQHDILAFVTVAIAPHAMQADFGLEMLFEAVINQRVEAIDALNDYIATFAAITTIGSAKGDILFAPEGNATRSTVAGADIDLGLVKKFHLVLLTA